MYFYCSLTYQPVKYHLLYVFSFIDIKCRICEQPCNSSLLGADQRWHEIYSTAFWKCGCRDLNEGRGRQRKRLKVGPWLTLLGFLSSPLLYECVRDRARARGWAFLWREKMSPLDVPHSRENLTRLNFSNMIGFPARDGWRGETDKEGRDQHLNSLSSHPATQITTLFVLIWCLF